MSFRELMFIVVLAAAAAAVIVGVGRVYGPAAWIVGGVLAAVLGWLVLGDDADGDVAGGDE